MYIFFKTKNLNEVTGVLLQSINPVRLERKGKVKLKRCGTNRCVLVYF